MGNEKIYRIDLTNPAAPNPLGVLFTDSTIPLQADGARCPNAPVGTFLTVVNNVVNDNNGSNVGADFGITTDAGVFVAGTAVVSGSTTAYTSKPLLVTPGNVSITAPNVANYTRSPNTWSCTNFSGSAVAVSHSINALGITGSLTIPDGEEVTCSITYDDDASCSVLSGEVNVAMSPISILKTENGDFKNKLFVATTNNTTQSGNVRAFAIGADELPVASESWNAASAMATQNQRGARLFTSVASAQSSTLVAFNSESLTNDSFQSNGVPDYQMIKNGVIAASMGRVSPNSNVTLLENDVDALRFLEEEAYRSFYTSTISQRSSTNGASVPAQVLVTSDDGFLYAFKQNAGELNWGWMPPSLALELKNAATFANQHFMEGEIDQLDLKSGSPGSYVFNSYVVGSYRDGLGQYVLKLNADGSLGAVVWDVDHKADNVLAVGAPNHGKRAYFTDANGKSYMAYTITLDGGVSKLYIRSLTDTSVNTEIVLGFTATSTPFVMPHLLGPASPAANTLFLGSDTGSIYAAPLFASDQLTLNPSLASLFASGASPLGAIHPAGQAASAIVYMDATVAVGDQYFLQAQAEDRITLFHYDSSDASWSPQWTTATAASLTGKWSISNGGSSFATDASITPLPANSRITDKAYIIASSLVLPVTTAPANANVCDGDAYYYFYKLDNGYTPRKTFFSTSDHSAITAGNIRLGKGDAFTMHLTTSPNSKKLVALGLAAQDINGNAGLSESFYINDPVTSGIRSWIELH